jgi:hypothetical protein
MVTLIRGFEEMKQRTTANKGIENSRLKRSQSSEIKIILKNMGWVRLG